MCFGKKAGLVCPAFCLITFSVEKTSKKKPPSQVALNT